MQGDLIKMRQASAQATPPAARCCCRRTLGQPADKELMQVLASQRQVEAKFESAQETAVRAEVAVPGWHLPARA